MSPLKRKEIGKSRRTVAQYVKHVAGNNEGNTTIIISSYDPKKSAGHKTIDVKTGHITVVKTVGEQILKRDIFNWIP